MRFRLKIREFKLKQLKERLLGELPKKVKTKIMVLTKKMDDLSREGDYEAVEKLWCRIIRDNKTSDLPVQTILQLYFHVMKYEKTLCFPHCGFMECLKRTKEINDRRMNSILLNYLKDFSESAEEKEWSTMIQIAMATN